MRSPPLRRGSCGRRSCAGRRWSRIWRSRPERVMPGPVAGLSRASTSSFLGATKTWMAETSPVMTKGESSRRVRIAPGDEFRHDKAFAASPELHVIALGVGDLAAGRGDERVSRRDVPFAGRAQARIDVGSPLRHPAEFNRGAEHLPDRAGPRLNESFGPDVSMRAADRHDPGVAAFRQRAGMNRLGYGPVRP